MAPPPSRYPTLADGTLVAPEAAGWPAIPGVTMPPAPMTTYRLDFGPEWAKGRVTIEPPRLGKAFVSLRAGGGRGRQRSRRDPAAADRGAARDAHRLELPPAVHRRARSPGERDRRLPPTAATAAEREQSGDSRRSIAERYPSRDAYLGRIAQAAVALVTERYLLAEDVAGLIRQAAAHYDWAVARGLYEVRARLAHTRRHEPLLPVPCSLLPRA